MVNLNLVKPNDLWYTVGLIVADGNLSIDGRHIYITLKDIALLSKIKEALFLPNKLGLKAREKEQIKKYGLLQFGDVRFYKFLLGIGLTPKKSLTLKSLKIPRKYFTDFLRGVIDGDGNIHTWTNSANNYIQWSLRITSGAAEFSQWLKSEIEDSFGVKGKLYTYTYTGKKNAIHIIKFGKLAAKVILEKIYYPGCLVLDRKYKQVLNCLKTKNGFKNYGDVIL